IPALWPRAGDLAAQLQASLVDQIAGEDLLLHESLTRTLAALKAELVAPGASRVEDLLAERVVATWLHLHYVEGLAADLLGRAQSPAEAEARGGRRAHAQRRYRAALRSLATVSKLLRPSLSPLDIATRLPVNEQPVSGRPGKDRARAQTLARG